MRKYCGKCRRELPLESFSRNSSKSDGLQSVCKYCARQYRLKYFMEDPLRVRNYSREWRTRNPEKDKNGRKAAIKKYRTNHADKHLAGKSLRQMVKYETVKRQPCVVCKRISGIDTPTVEAHHSDYSRRADVTWLCQEHHKAWHRVFEAR